MESLSVLGIDAYFDVKRKSKDNTRRMRFVGVSGSIPRFAHGGVMWDYRDIETITGHAGKYIKTNGYKSDFGGLRAFRSLR